MARPSSSVVPLACARWLPIALLALGLCPRAARAEGLKDKVREHVVEGVERVKEKRKKAKKPEPVKEEPAPPAEKPAEPAGSTTPAAEPAETSKGQEPTSGETRPAPANGAPASEAGGTAETSGEAPAAAAERPKPEPDAGDLSFRFDSQDDEAPPKEEKPKGPKLPVRVLGEDLKLDITVGGGYRGWYPQQYDSVQVDIASYFTWNVDVKAKLFKFLSLRRGYYESNGLAAPRTEEAAVAAKIGSYAPKAAWLLGVIGIPISKAWEPQIRYESRAFDTEAIPRRPVCLVPRSATDEFDVDMCPQTTDHLKIISSFETLVAGVRYDHSRSGSVVVEQKGAKVPPLFFGIGLVQYRKPYQVVIDEFVLPDLLFNGRFRGAGLAAGADFGGGLNNFFADADVQLGLGEVSLTDHLTLNEVVSSSLPTDPLIGYVLGTGGLGYRWTMIRAAPTLILVPSVRLGGASFFLVNTKTDQGEESPSPSVNWDFLWTVQLSLLVPL